MANILFLEGKHPEISSLKSFDNSRGKSLAKFFTLHILFLFTLDESNMHPFHIPSPNLPLTRDYEEFGYNIPIFIKFSCGVPKIVQVGKSCSRIMRCFSCIQPERICNRVSDYLYLVNIFKDNAFENYLCEL